MPKTKHTIARPSPQRKLINVAAADLGLKLKSATWEPIGRGGEMQGPSRGWEVLTEDGQSFYGLNAAEVVKDMRDSVKYDGEQNRFKSGTRYGISIAAKHKDELIRKLRQAVATGNHDEQVKETNRIKAEAVLEFFLAVHATADLVRGPINWNFAMQEVATLALGDCWRKNFEHDFSNEPVKFKPVPQSDCRKLALSNASMG